MDSLKGEATGHRLYRVIRPDRLERPYLPLRPWTKKDWKPETGVGATQSFHV
jgi:hypothetical protein